MSIIVLCEYLRTIKKILVTRVRLKYEAGAYRFDNFWILKFVPDIEEKNSSCFFEQMIRTICIGIIRSSVGSVYTLVRNTTNTETAVITDSLFIFANFRVTSTICDKWVSKFIAFQHRLIFAIKYEYNKIDLWMFAAYIRRVSLNKIFRHIHEVFWPQRRVAVGR